MCRTNEYFSRYGGASKKLRCDPEEINIHRIAKELGKFPHEIRALPVDEYDGLVAFFIFESREQQPKSKKVDPSLYAKRGK